MATLPDTSRPPATRLTPRTIAKPWGRRDLGPWGLGLDGGSEPIGEILHVEEGGDERSLLIKTLFTAERLSIQVHPDDAAAKARGHARGKDEAWVVLAAEPGAKIGVGLDTALDAAALRAAATDGSIVDRLVWRDCAAGDVFFTPAGTIHAIGGGLTLFEIQQNLDVTYRLFDYGRGRRLDLDDGTAVAKTAAWQPPVTSPTEGRDLLVACDAFVIERISGAGRIEASPAAPVWVAAVSGTARLNNAVVAPGEVWLIEAAVRISGDAELLLTREALAPTAWQPDLRPA